MRQRQSQTWRGLWVAVVVLLLAREARAWSDAGHKIIASIAWRQLSPNQQAYFVRLIEHHPRFHEDFLDLRGRDLGRATVLEENEWLIQQAAIWPDHARSFHEPLKAQYHRGPWHYINLPVFLEAGDQRVLAEPIRKLNLSLVPPQDPIDAMNVVQVIRLARARLHDRQTSAVDRAVWLCWLMHALGDVHQPLHSTALFSAEIFPEGDRGGNEILTKQHGNLHSVWDNFLGGRIKFGEVQRRALTLVNDRVQLLAGSASVGSVDEEVWLAESHQLVKKVVHSPEVIEFCRNLPPHDPTQNGRPDRNGPVLVLSEDYLRKGGRVAQERVLEAGYRLGLVLSELAPQ